MDKVGHFEFPYEDLSRAKEFYSKVFGWKFQDFSDMNYTMAFTVETDEQMMPKESGAINGGLYKRDENSSKTPVVIVGVESVDDKIKEIEFSGGKVLLKKQLGNMGFYAQVSDTEGNIIGIWERIREKEEQTQSNQ